MTKQDNLEVTAGEDLDATYYMFDRSTGTFVDWETGTWEVGCDIRDRTGALLARMANFGVGNDGTISLLTEGRLALHLPAAVTADLPVTRPYTNNTDVRVAGRRHRRAHFFDIKAVETVTNNKSVPVLGLLTVDQAVTE